MFSIRHSGSRGHRHEQVALGAARHLGERVLGVGHVLEHLDRAGQVELVGGERQVLGLHHAVLEVGRLALGPAGLDRLLLEVDADHARVAQALRPALHEHALAAADVEQRVAAGALEQLVQGALEAGHQAAHDGIGRAVLVVGVAGDDAVLGDGHAAHSRTASCSGSCAGFGFGSEVGAAFGS